MWSLLQNFWKVWNVTLRSETLISEKLIKSTKFHWFHSFYVTVNSVFTGTIVIRILIMISLLVGLIYNYDDDMHCRTKELVLKGLTKSLEYWNSKTIIRNGEEWSTWTQIKTISFVLFQIGSGIIVILLVIITATILIHMMVSSMIVIAMTIINTITTTQHLIFIPFRKVFGPKDVSCSRN